MKCKDCKHRHRCFREYDLTLGQWCTLFSEDDEEQLVPDESFQFAP